MSESYESKALSGGFVLVGRQLLGIVLNLVTVLISTRLLGPGKYGELVILAGLSGYATNVGKLGLDVYLIRYQGDLDQGQVGVTQGLYLAIGLFLAVLMATTAPFIAWWYHDSLLCHLLWSYALLTPVTLLSFIPIALLDRQLLYKQAAMTELAGQLCYVGLSLPSVWLTGSVWGIVAGTFGQVAVTIGLATYWSNMRFRPRWSPLEAKAQIRYGIGYSASTWVWQGRDLVNPLLVGKMLGAEAAAFVAMAVRLAGLVSFAKSAIWRVYMSYLARLGDDRAKMREAVAAGLSHQVLITGVSFIAFMAISPELVRGVMGEKWLPILNILPFVASGLTVNSGFSLYSSALYIIGRNLDVTLFHALHVILFACFAFLLLRIFGSLSCYGWAEVAAFPSYLMIRHMARKHGFAGRENLMYLNLVFILAGLFLNMQLIAMPSWLRLGTASLLLLVLLFGVAANRSATLVMLNMARQRLARGKV